MLKQKIATLLIFFGITFLYTNEHTEEECQYFSQYDQDRYVNEQFFKNKKGGVFVEIGAYDGVLLSNTFFFKKYLGWTGICIEPIPDVFSRLKSNRSAICVQGCICSGEDQVNFSE